MQPFTARLLFFLFGLLCAPSNHPHFSERFGQRSAKIRQLLLAEGKEQHPWCSPALDRSFCFHMRRSVGSILGRACAIRRRALEDGSCCKRQPYMRRLT